MYVCDSHHDLIHCLLAHRVAGIVFYRFRLTRRGKLDLHHFMSSFSQLMFLSLLVWMALLRPVHLDHNIGNIFASVAFMWDPSTLGLLVATLGNFEAYDSNVHIVVVTNNGPALEGYLRHMGLHHVQIRQVHGLPNLQYLPRAHFEVVREAVATGQFSTYMYVENDLFIPWNGIQAWAQDVDELDKFGFQRGLLRVGVDKDGVLVCPDNAPNLSGDDAPWRQPAIDLSTYDKLLNLSASHHPAFFVQLRHSYWAGYVLTLKQMQAYMQSDRWAVDGRWGPQEDAASGNQYVNIPAGFDTNTVVPYNPYSKELLSSAYAFHLSNKYAMSRYSNQVSVADLLKGK